ncbi:MAG: hypothetical protein WCP19_05700, partial [Chloroflexota bacterium]
WIMPDETALLPEFYNPEPPHGWCYDFSQAELAGQTEDWQKVTAIYNKAVKAGERPDDPMENFVFIEAFAHTGEWQTARNISITAYKFSKEFMRPNLCALWLRIDRNIPANPEKNNIVNSVKNELGCG